MFEVINNTITNGECTTTPTPTTAPTSTQTSPSATKQTGGTDIPKTGESGTGSMLTIGFMLIILGGLSLALVNRSRKRVEPIAIQSFKKKDEE